MVGTLIGSVDTVDVDGVWSDPTASAVGIGFESAVWLIVFLLFPLGGLVFPVGGSTAGTAGTGSGTVGTVGTAGTGGGTVDTVGTAGTGGGSSGDDVVIADTVDATVSLAEFLSLEAFLSLLVIFLVGS